MNGKPDDIRPEPDQSFSRLKQEKARARRSKLKIFFGALIAQRANAAWFNFAWGE